MIRISAGSVWLAAYAADAPRRAHTWVNEWRLRPTRWTGDECTYLIRPGKYYATGYFVPRGRETGGKFYVNAQTPMRRLAGSIETLDLELDVEMREPDLVPRWKDTDLFTRMADRRRLPPPLRDRIRRDAEEAVSELRRPAARSLLRRMSRIPVPVPSLGPLFPTSRRQVPCAAHPLDDGAS